MQRYCPGLFWILVLLSASITLHTTTRLHKLLCPCPLSFASIFTTLGRSIRESTLRCVTLCAHTVCLSSLYECGIPACMARGPRCDVAGMHAIVRGQEGGHFSHDCVAFLSAQSFKLCHPGTSLAKVWKFWCLSPSPSGVCRRTTSSQQMHVDFPIGWGRLRALRLSVVVEAPAARIKIIDTSALQLRQDLQHSFACGGHDERPQHQL